jgi:cholesterol oxidase
MSTVRFTEEMLGHITFGETDFARGAEPARDGSADFKFHLTIEVADMDAFARDPLRPARAHGWVHCDALGGRLPVMEGWFNLFVDQAEPGVKHMLYRLWFYDGVGHPLTMTGFKVVANDAGFDLWKDTTTLFTRVLRGHVAEREDEAAEVVASGIIVIRIRDFAKQLTTFRATGPRPLGALARFGAIFVGQLAQVYLRRGSRQRVAAQG